jgi:hypothetical protein
MKILMLVNWKIACCAGKAGGQATAGLSGQRV